MSAYYYFTRIEHKLKNFLAKNKHSQIKEHTKQLLQGIEPLQGVQPPQKNNENPKQEILFVCTGNICRSAYAHHALKELLAKQSITNVKVFSAGVATTPGKRADKTAKKVAEKRGIDLENHITSFIYRDGLLNASLIVVMEPVHARRILYLEPGIGNKIVYGGHLADDSTCAIVADPYGQSEERFEECFDILDKVVTKIADLLPQCEDSNKT